MQNKALMYVYKY